MSNKLFIIHPYNKVQCLPDIPGQTKSDLERSALRATVLRTSLSPTFPDKQSPTSNARRWAPR